MNWFWTREARLARRLKAERPEPSRLFMGSLMERLEPAESPRARRSFGLRVSLAAAVSLALLAGLATFGGLGYAATSIANVGRTASHVVVPQHQGPATPTRENSSNDGNSSNGQSNGQSSSKGHDQNGESGDDEDDNDESSAHSQYDLEIVCVLVFPGTKYEHILRLPRFLVPFFLAHHPDAVVVTCPVRRNSG